MAAARKESLKKGKLRIGDDWNAITIIALSQQNPLKAVAEIVENAIDAHARHITITRARGHDHHFLRFVDDGDGIPRGEDGAPDFQYVATHICDSLKRRLDPERRQGIQGEFGIGLLSFWTLGEELALTSSGADGRTWEMRMRKGDPAYTVAERRRLFASKGTEVVVGPLLSGIRQLNGEKIQWYLASELRDRIRQNVVRIEVMDRVARSRYEVTPREFNGRLLHQLPTVRSPFGEMYLELYLADPLDTNIVGLYRHGTRVIENVTSLDAFQRPPWSSRCLQGIIEAPFLVVTPGTRTGFLLDERYTALCDALQPAEAVLNEAIEEQRRAAEERASREILRSIHRAFREALLSLPPEEYDWFEINQGRETPRTAAARQKVRESETEAGTPLPSSTGEPEIPEQRKFFDFAGPLFSVVISPAACTMPAATSRRFRAVPRDQRRRVISEGLSFEWEIAEGGGELVGTDAEDVVYRAAADPGLVRLTLAVRQGETRCEAEALVTVTAELLPDEIREPRTRQGLPAYTFERAPGELWRARFDAERNLIVINNAHRDFVFASRNRSVKLRYICRLYVKELVLKNFPGLSADRLLERMVELSLYTEEHLR
jgi:hypothetical protein